MGKKKKKKEMDFSYMKYVFTGTPKKEYMNMEKPFHEIPEPKNPIERKYYVERLDSEFGEDYVLNDFIDPAEEMTDAGEPKYPTHEDLQIERIRRVKNMHEEYKKAKKYHDVETRKRIRAKALKPINIEQPVDFNNFNYAKYNSKLKGMFE